MSFSNVLSKWGEQDVTSILTNVTTNDIEVALSKEFLNSSDFLALISPQAKPYLEVMAQKAHEMTVNNFGKVIGLYTPMYLGNYCTNRCVYCGFNTSTKIKRSQLTFEEIATERDIIIKDELKHILIVTGDAPKITTIEYMQEAIKILREKFSSISIEVYALTELEYKALVEVGAEGLTIYQETYDRTLYDQIHLSGPKKDFEFRLNAPERGIQAGMKMINIGALLGLGNWYFDAFMTALHTDYLQRKYPHVEMSISLPRIRPCTGGYKPKSIVSDHDFVQLMLAFRIFLPRLGINVSTRESPEFRNNILELGVTKMSAGVSTSVGGRQKNSEENGQFDKADERSVKEMEDFLKTRGYQAVKKDWEILC